jgi:hypothetical protein
MTPEFVRTTWNDTTIEGLLQQSGSRPARTVLAQTHPREWSCLAKWPGPALPEWGVDTFSFNNRYVNSTAGTELVTVFENLARDVGAAVAHLRDRGYERVVLYGHSAGGPTMAFYQALAEGGNDVAACRDDLGGFDGFATDGAPLVLPPADGIVFAASTIGTGASFLLRLDPSVVDEVSGARTEDLDLFSPANGFDPSTGAGSYSHEFLHSYRAGQAARMDRLIRRAQELVAGEERSSPVGGNSPGPAVMVIRGTRADPKAVDLRLARHTADAYRLEPGGRHQVIETTRLLRPSEHTANRRLPGTAVHLAHTFLSYRAIRPTPRYAQAVTGIALDGMEYESVHSSVPGNLDHVTVPLLFVQGTSDANPQLPSAELNYRAATSSTDKELVFVAGAEHAFSPTAPVFGDTRAVATEVMARWIAERFGV